MSQRSSKDKRSSQEAESPSPSKRSTQQDSVVPALSEGETTEDVAERKASVSSKISSKKGSLGETHQAETARTQPIKPLPLTDPSWLAKRIMCVGVCNFDIFHLVKSFPDENTKSSNINGWWARGGKPSNSCTVLSLLGAKTEFLGVLSTQAPFRGICEDFRRHGIYTRNCPGVSQYPPLASIILEENTATRTVVISNPSFPILTNEHFKTINLCNYNWIHFEGRNPEETGLMIQEIRSFNEAQEDKIIISLGPEELNDDIMALAENVDYFFLAHDLAQSKGWNDAKDAVYGLRNKIKTENKPAIIASWGAQGADCLDSEGNYARCHGVRIDNVVDSSGAGATFCAATIFALVHMNLGLKHAIEYSNMITAFKLQHKGFDAIAKFKRRTGGPCSCKPTKN